MINYKIWMKSKVNYEIHLDVKGQLWISFGCQWSTQEFEAIGAKWPTLEFEPVVRGIGKPITTTRLLLIFLRTSIYM